MLKRFALGACASILLGACTESDPLTSPTQSSLGNRAQLEIAAAVSGRYERGIEDDILRMEAEVPGLGGAFVENGNLVVLVPDVGARVNVMAGLARASSFLNIDPAARGRMARGEHIELRPARYAFSQLIAWQEVLGAALNRSGGVSTSDADERANRIAIGIVAPEFRSQVLAAAEKTGVPVDALEITVGPLARPMSTLRDAWNTSSARAKAGVQIANAANSYCTIGWNVHRGPDSGDGAEEGFFTAGHCVYGQAGAGVTGPIYQPTSSTSIGYITQDSAWDVSNALCDHSYCTQVDAMYVTYNDSTISSKTLAQPTYGGTGNNSGSITLSGSDWTDLSGNNYSFFVGDSVDKVGRTTGWTRGALSATCQKVNTGVPGYDPYTVLCANEVSGAAFGAGDSGGPVFQIASGPAIVKRGILFAGNGDFHANSEEFPVCYNNCVYYYSTYTRIMLYLPEPPY
jgi:hypothetical protein